MMASTQRPIMVMAGGTGGHVFPALAVANYLRDQGESIVWMGTQNGIEARLVPADNFPIEWLKVQGLRGKGLLVKAMAPFKLLQACFQALQLLRKHRPKAVLGMGGFASGPGGLMAWLLGIPLIIHEQNAVTGLTNKYLSRVATLKYFAFPQAALKFCGSIVVGNPVRKDIIGLEHPSTRLKGHDNQRLNLLVVGGSLGARSLNQTLPAALSLIEQENRPAVHHQCGAKHLSDCQKRYREFQVEGEIMEFIDDMPAAYASADLVICRAGALTIAELAAAGLASILVPFPYAVDDHQFANAAFLSDAGAALVVRDEDFSADYLAQKIAHFSRHRSELVEMACRAREIAYTDATEQVAKGILQEALA